MHDTHTALPQLQLHILFHTALLLAYKVAYCITFRARKRTSIHELHLCTSSLPLQHVYPPLQLPEADLSPHGTLHTLGVQLQCNSHDSVHNFAVQVAAWMLYKLLERILSIHHSIERYISIFSL